MDTKFKIAVIVTGILVPFTTERKVSKYLRLSREDEIEPIAPVRN